MCGRYATTRSAGDLSALFESYDDTDGRLAPDHNVAPTDPVPVVRMDGEAGRVLSAGRWGLVPHWSRSAAGAARMINARVETVATSRAYADPFARRRCLVPADGWYEWVRRPAGGKQPYYMTPRDGSVLAFAGIWSRWESLLTFSVLTTAAVGELAEVHDRMPLLLPADRWAAWLGPADDPATLLAPPPVDWLGGLEIRPVGPAVGDVRNDGPELIERVPLPEERVEGEMTLF
ncbi:SOS response-associated peptidase [Micromonospora purpureochromogenes]|uniref:Abasic site processing protein n=1 Tax=Micromonospora purpureochromogenes TaxID=47872 RepID=A0ABX2RIV3_9ACTN|nr:SOS response-associated peptidase [Micromonospora purpureochromogenes]NYF55059.1 putative SOS response-associated peptidase YedK [Micromonospora purpureochromogenes]